MRKVIKAVSVIGDALTLVAIAALIVMICVTVADIFLKNLFKAPIPGAVEITRMMMVCITPSFVSALFAGRHVNVGLFVDKLGRKGQLAFDTFGYLMTAAICGIICYQGFIDMSKKIAQSQVYTILKWPTWPFYAIFAVSMGFFGLAIIIKLIDNFISKDYPESIEGGASH